MSEKMPVLLPCPFCGGAQIGLRDDGGLRFFDCAQCEACGPLAGDEDIARLRWNKRTP